MRIKRVTKEDVGVIRNRKEVSSYNIASFITITPYSRGQKRDIFRLLSVDFADEEERRSFSPAVSTFYPTEGSRD